MQAGIAFALAWNAASSQKPRAGLRARPVVETCAARAKRALWVFRERNRRCNSFKRANLRSVFERSTRRARLARAAQLAMLCSRRALACGWLSVRSRTALAGGL